MDNLFWSAERDLKYHLLPGGHFMAISLSAPANFSYNLAYLLNLPAKLIHNISMDIKFKKMVTGESSDKGLDKTKEITPPDNVTTAITNISLWSAVILDVISQVWRKNLPVAGVARVCSI